jgi:hypothetical protein
VSRSKSPWIAAKKAERLRHQRGKERLMVAAVILLMSAALVSYAFYWKYYYFSKPGSVKRPSVNTNEPK